MPGITQIRVNRSSLRWQADFGRVKGKRHRRIYQTKAEAVEALRQHKEEVKHTGQIWAQLSPGRRADVVMILQDMAKHGTTLREVWDHFKETKQPRAGRTVSQIIKEFIAAKIASGVSKKYETELRSYLGMFEVGREDVDIAEISPAVLDQWFASRKKESASTRETGLRRLSSMFSFCERREYIRENPCKRVERVRVPQVKPEILSVAECKRLVKAAAKIDKGMLTYLGLALFCGIRPDEAKRLHRKDINLERGLVFLDAEKSKVRNRRIVELTDPARRCIEAGGPVPKSNFPKRFNALRRQANIEYWPHDALRKTAASHFYNIYGIEKATEQLGHSAGVLLRVYRELVSNEETGRWLAI